MNGFPASTGSASFRLSTATLSTRWSASRTEGNGRRQSGAHLRVPDRPLRPRRDRPAVALSNGSRTTSRTCSTPFSRPFPAISACPRRERLLHPEGLADHDLLPERRQEEYEKIGWWEFIGAAEQSKAYQNLFGHGITRALVASKARLASTFTIGNTFIQLLFDMVDPSVPTSDRVLNGPTNLVWILPWLNYLESRGVTYHVNTPVKDINYAGGRIESVTVIKGGSRKTIKGDYYVAALPIEQFVTLITPALTMADPALENLPALANDVEWMTGIQFYLKRRVPLVDGHVNYIDSPWALTSVSHTQFWPDFEVHNFYNGGAHDVLSVDISDWNAKGLNGKTMTECTRDEIARETWAQIKRSVNVNGREVLKDEDWDYWFIDPDINQSADDRRVILNRSRCSSTTRTRCGFGPTRSPRFPTSSSPRTTCARTRISPTMEAANEAARRAVNGILDASGSSAKRCDVWPLHEPKVLEPFRECTIASSAGNRACHTTQAGQRSPVGAEPAERERTLAPWSGPFTHPRVQARRRRARHRVRLRESRRSWRSRKELLTAICRIAGISRDERAGAPEREAPPTARPSGDEGSVSCRVSRDGTRVCARSQHAGRRQRGVCRASDVLPRPDAPDPAASPSLQGAAPVSVRPRVGVPGQLG